MSGCNGTYLSTTGRKALCVGLDSREEEEKDFHKIAQSSHKNIFLYIGASIVFPMPV